MEKKSFCWRYKAKIWIYYSRN